MSASGPAVSVENLLAHRDWVRRLAVALTRDDNDADDIEQQTWLAAVRSPPRTGESPRGWLGAVARNAARKRGRSEGRRRQRETRAARPESAGVEDPAELVARADLHAKVAMAVVALDEPYRQALLLRYFEGLGVGEVSARMEAPIETTRARLRRGREQLRGRLCRDVAGGRSLAVALLPLLDRTTGPTGTGTVAAVVTGGLAMSKIGFGAVVGLLLLTGIWWGARPGEEAAPTDVAQVAEVVDRSPVAEKAPQREPPRPRVRRPDREDDRSILDEGGDSANPESAPRTITERLAAPIARVDFSDEKVRVVFGEISDVTGVPIHLDARAETSIESVPLSMHLDGVPAKAAMRVLAMMTGLALAVEEDRVVLHRSSDEWSPGLPTILIEPKSRDPDRPQRITVRGQVTDTFGSPVAGVVLVHQNRIAGTTDDHGAFELELKKPFFRLVAQKSGSQRSQPRLVEGGYGDVVEMDFVLGPPAGAARITVTSSTGKSIELARLKFRWTVPGETRRTRDGDEVPLVRSLGRSSRNGEPTVVEILPPGEVELTVSAKGHVRETVVVDVREGETAQVAVELRRADVADRVREERISIEVVDEELRHVLSRIRRQMSLDVVLLGPASARYFQHLVTLSLRDDTVRSALDAICHACDGKLKWTTRGDLVLLVERETE